MFFGNINLALNYLTVFLKLAARSTTFIAHFNHENGVTEDAKVNRANWIKKHLLDEFSPLASYNNLPDQITLGEENQRPTTSWYTKVLKLLTGKSQPTHFIPHTNLTNRVGSAYHVTNQALLLENMSPELITIATTYENLIAGQSHGSVKVFADVLLLQSLKKIDQYLDTFNQDK